MSRDSVLGTCRTITGALHVPHAFSHLTAALLHELPVSRAMAEDERAHVIRGGPDRMIRRRNVCGHRGLECREVADVDGLPVVGLADTWVDMGELIAPGRPVGLDDLIILGDAVATRLGSVQPLVDALERRVRPRGRLTLLEALEWIRVGSESPGETRTRLVLVRAGLPEPELNQPILGPGGRRLGRPDLRYSHALLAIEYQGEQFHGSDESKILDRARFARFGSVGWTVREVWADDLNSDEGRYAFVRHVAGRIGVPEMHLTLADCHPRFFSARMLELGEIRIRRAKARHLAERS